MAKSIFSVDPNKPYELRRLLHALAITLAPKEVKEAFAHNKRVLAFDPSLSPPPIPKAVVDAVRTYAVDLVAWYEWLGKHPLEETPPPTATPLHRVK